MGVIDLLRNVADDEGSTESLFDSLLVASRNIKEKTPVCQTNIVSILSDSILTG